MIKPAQVWRQAATTRRNSNTVSVSTLALPLRQEHIITVCGHDRAEANRILNEETRALQARGLNHLNFGEGCRFGALPSDLSDAQCVQKEGLWSLQTIAVSKTSPTPILLRGRTIGVVYEDEYARYCHLSTVIPEDRNASRAAQARVVFETLNQVLQSNDFRFTDTVRTWFYLDHLLDWYDEFNAVRTAFFTEQGVFDKRVPASTGISAGNPWNCALSCDLLAVQPKSEALRIQAVASPLQCSALNYKSSFSRAVELAFPTHRNLWISGTASIAPEGQTAHVGNVEGQIELTMQVVSALLESRQLGWTDVCRGIAYFTDMRNMAVFERYCREHRIPDFPLAVACVQVCRKDLLFELEVDAVGIA